MSLKHLRTLVAISEHRTFSRAADKICLTHAAVSQHMTALEREMGVPLFDRSRRTPELNATGRALVERARDLIRTYDTLIPSILGKETLSGDFTLGAVPTTINGLAPKGINALKLACPHLRLSLSPGLTRPLLVAVERHQADAALVTRPRSLPPWLTFRKLATESLMLIVSHEVEGTDPQELLSTRPFIRFNRDAVVGAEIERWVRARDIQVTEAMELETLDAISAMVHANLGVSIVPKPCVLPENPLPLRWLALEENAPSRELGLAFRGDTTKQLVIEEVYQAFQGSMGGQA